SPPSTNCALRCQKNTRPTSPARSPPASSRGSPPMPPTRWPGRAANASRRIGARSRATERSTRSIPAASRPSAKSSRPRATRSSKKANDSSLRISRKKPSSENSS
ncbi:uncharacterized protein METZ01_LOCUS135665, partial [marine metagenome]